jgi:hypothetical protein
MRQTTRIRGNAAHFMTTYRWQLRKQQAIEMLKQEADRAEKAEEEVDDDPLSAMANPLGMLKGNMAFMVQNMVMMQGIQHFFSGFILLQIPFKLTAGFKPMFQRGLADLPDLEPSYVSSVSWYFLVMYGLRSFFQLAIGELPLEVREQEQLQQKLGKQNPPPPGKNQDGATMAKMLRQEAENLSLLPEFKSQMDGVEKRLLGKRYPKKKVAASDDFLIAKKRK